MPLAAGYSLLATGGSIWYRLRPEQRRDALHNYAAVLGRDVADPEVRRVTEGAFRNYGRMLLDFIRAGSADRNEVERRVRHSGTEHLEAALKHGRGAIMAVPHMGAWDLGAAAIGIRGYPTYAVAEVFPGSLNDAIVDSRERFGLHIIPLDRRAVRRIQDALAANCIVGLVCDLPHGPGLTAEFFGRPAQVPAGPAAFALKTGAPVVTAHMYRVDEDVYQAQIDPALVFQPSGDRRSDQVELTQAILKRFEAYISARPTEWFAFRRIFLDQEAVSSPSEPLAVEA